MTIKKSKSFYQPPTHRQLPQFRVDQFRDLQILKEGSYYTLYSATHADSENTIALKCVHKNAMKKEDFLQELYYNYFLSPHPNVITSFEEAYQTSSCYISTHELATEGDLASYIGDQGLPEPECKRIADQVSHALEFMHNQKLVHQSLNLENIHVFNSDMSKVKLGDFSTTRSVDKLLKKHQPNTPWEPPEICEAVYNEGYYPHQAQDSWQLGVLIYVCLTGTFPWLQADITDTNYNNWVQWQKRKTTKVPHQFRQFSPRLLRLFRRLLEPKAGRRAEVQEVRKYLTDSWQEKNVTSLLFSLPRKRSRVLSLSTSGRCSMDTSYSTESMKGISHEVLLGKHLYRHHTFHN